MIYSDQQLQKYKVIRKIGSGGFGQVFQVKDAKGDFYALKQINMANMKSGDRKYIDAQIQIMMKFQSQYITKIYNNFETNSDIYIVLEYCNGGDLTKQMARMPNKRFTVEQTVRIISDVIRGLQAIHLSGFLHRDIKPQNIFVKTLENGQKIYKIGDFGLSKKQAKAVTFVGTPHYMSPEIIYDSNYGYQVDIWSLGVTMFFMLNRDYPFKINQRQMNQEYYNQLKQKGQNFSYKNAVQNSKYKFTENCTQELQDLFKRMLDSNPEQRITFLQIRTHKLFSQHFPQQLNQTSVKMYKSKINCSNIKDKKNFLDVLDQLSGQSQSQKSVSIKRTFNYQQDSQFPKQKQIIQHVNSKIQFLYGNYKQFLYIQEFLPRALHLGFSYNLLKYYLILKKKFINAIQSKSICENYKQYKLRQYFLTDNFKEQLKLVKDQYNIVEAEYEYIFYQCFDNIKDITVNNKHFSPSYRNEIIEQSFQEIKKSYCYSVNNIIQFLQPLKDQGKGNKVKYYLALSILSYAFNRFFQQKDKDKFAILLKDLFKGQNVDVNSFDFERLREEMTKSSSQQLNKFSLLTYSIYIQKKK